MTLSTLPAFSTRNIHRPPPLAHIALRRHSVLANPTDEDFLHGYHPCARVSEEMNCPTTPTTPVPQSVRSDCCETGAGNSETSLLLAPANPEETQQWCPASPLASTVPASSTAGIFSTADSSPSSSSSPSISPISPFLTSSPPPSLASMDMPESDFSSSANGGGDEFPTTPTTPLPGTRSGSSSSSHSSVDAESNSTSRNNSAEASITQIFQFQRWKPTKQESIPKLNDTQPLSLYFHADEQLTAAVRALSKVRETQSEKHRRYTDRVHRAQNLLLDTVYLIYAELDDHMKSPRDYRRHLPSEDQAELDDGFSENILFAAEALSRGFRIRGIESFTDQLLEPAKQLCASFEALRFVFRCRALEQHRCGSTNVGSGGQRLRSLTPGLSSVHSPSSPPLQNPYVPLYPVLVDFDKAWTGFEQRICFAYFAVTYNRHYGTPLPTVIPDTFPSTFPPPDPDTEMFAVLVSESLIRATTRKLITWTQIQECHPAVMFAIPRLSIVAGLVHMPECVNMTDPENSFWWFREKVQILQQLQKSLRGLSSEELDMLERALVGEIEDDEEETVEPSDIFDKEDASAPRFPTVADKFGPSEPTGCSASLTSPPHSDSNSSISLTLSKPHLRLLFTTVCSIADGLQSGPRARDFSSVLEKVFNCHS